eukprot:jgi/Orpsp1_1/1186001/evm.model.c7180000096404.1
MKCSDSNECDSSYCNSEGYCEYSEGGGESSVGSAVGKFFNLIYIFVGSLVIIIVLSCCCLINLCRK